MYHRRFYRVVSLIAIIEFVPLLILSGIFDKKYVLPRFCSTFTNDTCLLDYEESAPSFISRYKEYCEKRFAAGIQSTGCHDNNLPLCPCMPDSVFNNDSSPAYKTCPDGFLMPSHCIPRHKSAIIIPFRDRNLHLKKMLKVLHRLLRKQNLAYQIFVVEQEGNNIFNKAILMNAGFLELLKISSNHHPLSPLPPPPTHAATHAPYPYPPTQDISIEYRSQMGSPETKAHHSRRIPGPTHDSSSSSIDCFIFHDVDMMPLYPFTNMYTCVDMPRHIGIFQETLNFVLSYEGIFGGVTGFRKEHFEAVNGFSNSFYGWGGEDDDMLLRVKAANFSVNRFPRSIARYYMLSHSADIGNPGNHNKSIAFDYDKSKYNMDGLTNVRYEVIQWRDQGDHNRVLIRVPLPPTSTSTYNRSIMFSDILRIQLRYFLMMVFIAAVVLLLLLQKIYVLGGLCVV